MLDSESSYADDVSGLSIEHVAPSSTVPRWLVWPMRPLRARGRGIRRDVAGEVPRAVDAEVHAQPQSVVELEEHLLADGLGVDHLVPVEWAGARGEAALRRGGRDALADEVQRELARDAMDGVTLGHGLV